MKRKSLTSLSGKKTKADVYNISELNQSSHMAKEFTNERLKIS